MKKALQLFLFSVIIFILCATSVLSEEYTVVKGDSLWKIAVKHEIGLSEIIQANPQIENPNLIYPD